MATRSTIAVKHNDGTVSSVYAHWDGYPSWNGKLLINHYNTLELAEKLVSLGSISSLKENIEPDDGVLCHTFDNPADDVTTFYARDRGEDLEVTKYSSYELYRLSNEKEEYNYIFVDGVWNLQLKRRMMPVTDAIKEDEE
jgi:hypothetical protein